MRGARLVDGDVEVRLKLEYKALDDIFIRRYIGVLLTTQ